MNIKTTQTRLSLLGLVAATAWSVAHVIRGHIATFADAIVLLAILGAAVMMARISLTRNTARRGREDKG